MTSWVIPSPYPHPCPLWPMGGGRGGVVRLDIDRLNYCCSHACRFILDTNLINIYIYIYIYIYTCDLFEEDYQHPPLLFPQSLQNVQCHIHLITELQGHHHHLDVLPPERFAFVKAMR